MPNDLKMICNMLSLVPREEGKFWGVTAAPIQSIVNLSIWIASAFRWSGWIVIEYQEQTNNLHSDGKIINNACQNRRKTQSRKKNPSSTEKTRLEHRNNTVDLDTKINGNAGITKAWAPLVSLNTEHRCMRDLMSIWNIGNWPDRHLGLNTGKLAWMPLRSEYRKKHKYIDLIVGNFFGLNTGKNISTSTWSSETSSVWIPEKT